MTRCLHCGAERTADACEECGLTSAIAEVLLRRHLINLTGVFLLGAVLFIPASNLYPPLELDGILIFVGILFFLTLGLGIWLDFRARHHAEVEGLKRIFRALIPVPWLLGSLVYLNGFLDRSPGTTHSAAVVSKFNMPGWVRVRRLVVVSWRPERAVERIAVDADRYDLLRRGDDVEIVVRDGLAGIPWVSSVHRKP